MASSEWGRAAVTAVLAALAALVLAGMAGMAALLIDARGRLSRLAAEREADFIRLNALEREQQRLQKRLELLRRVERLRPPEVILAPPPPPAPPEHDFPTIIKGGLA